MSPVPSFCVLGAVEDGVSLATTSKRSAISFSLLLAKIAKRVVHSF